MKRRVTFDLDAHYVIINGEKVWLKYQDFSVPMDSLLHNRELFVRSLGRYVIAIMRA